MRRLNGCFPLSHFLLLYVTQVHRWAVLFLNSLGHIRMWIKLQAVSCASCWLKHHTHTYRARAPERYHQFLRIFCQRRNYCNDIILTKHVWKRNTSMDIMLLPSTVKRRCKSNRSSGKYERFSLNLIFTCWLVGNLRFLYQLMRVAE